MSAVVYVKCGDESTREVVTRLSPAIITLAHCSRLVVAQMPPPGCAILTVSDTCELHVNLKGLVDPEKELSKLGKKEEFLQQSIAKLEQAMTIVDYESKVPREVREANSSKLAMSKGELLRLQQAMASLRIMQQT